MKTHLSTILSAACLSALLSSNLNAAETKPDKHAEHEHEMEQHGSHEHGAARMTVAVTETGLEIALETPAANLFGFEHNANNDEEQHIVHEAVLTLRAGNQLFMANKGAECQMTQYTMESDIVARHVRAMHDGEGLDEAGHYLYAGSGDKAEHEHGHEDEEHAEEGKEGHDKHEDHDHTEKDGHAKETHSDVTATWIFKCEQPAQLTQMETGIFNAFPNGFGRLNIEWINEDAAGAIALEADGTVKFTQ